MKSSLFEGRYAGNLEFIGKLLLEGGYAKFSQIDADRIRTFSHIVGIDFEPIYSGKMILALLDLIASGYFPEHHRIVLLHTGGLQGLAGMFERGLLNQDEWPLLPAPPVR